MARKVRHSALESRSARLKLQVRRKPFPGPSLSRGVSLLYRRNKTNGTWVLKASDGHGAYWTKRVGDADDYAESDGKDVLYQFMRRSLPEAWWASLQQRNSSPDRSRPHPAGEQMHQDADRGLKASDQPNEQMQCEADKGIKTRNFGESRWHLSQVRRTVFEPKRLAVGG